MRLKLTGHIEVRNVSFRYHPDAPWAIRNVSVVIEPGQKVAIVGRTGSGKSTLAMLLLGLYPAKRRRDSLRWPALCPV